MLTYSQLIEVRRMSRSVAKECTHGQDCSISTSSSNEREREVSTGIAVIARSAGAQATEREARCR
jgi:hypothetical protein